MLTPVPYDEAFFDEQVAGSHRSANIVLPLLFEQYKPGSIVDVGCGVGPWLKCARTLGVEDVFGIDGEYVDRARLLIDGDRFQAVDLSRRFDLGRRFDLAISVEVAEHLPSQRSETFVADLTALSDVVLFCAALPFQGGSNHINEQWLEFWAILFRRHGYVACDFLRPRLWTRPEVDFWYAQNLLVFCHRNRVSELFSPEVVADGRALSLPHPLTFLVNVARYRPLAAEALDFEYEDYLTLLKAHLAGDTLLPPLRISGAFSQQSGIALFPTARTAIADARDELNGKDQEIARVNNALAAREEERGRLIAELAAAAESARHAMGALTARDEEMLRLTVNLTGQVTAREAEIRRLTTELTAATESARYAMGALTARDEEIRRLTVDLTGQVTAREAEIRQLTTDLAGQTEQGERLAMELAARNREIDAQKAEIQRLAAEMAAAGTSWSVRLQDCLAQIERLGSAFSQEKDHAASLEREVEESARRFQTRDYEARRAAADLAESWHTVEALRQSWSWRLTAPLRAVVELGLRIRGLIRGTGRDISLRSKFLGLLQWYWFRRQVRASGLFDERYYLARSPDVALSQSDPLRHFFVFGAAEARNPHPLFDLRYYFGRYPDVANSSINPLVHYLKWGASEGRDPHSHFDTSFYLDRNPEVRQAGLNPLAHYMGPGIPQGLDPNPWFDTSEYLEHNPHVALKGLNPLLHHLEQRVASRREYALSEHGPGMAPTAAVPTESGGLPPQMRIDPRTTELRARLRAEYQLSGRPLLDSDYDSVPLVSVLIPCYNYGYYLEDAILSAMMACSYPMEIVVVDDGSTDEGSIAAVNEMAERYHFRLVRQSNTGLTGARYNGLRDSRGKFIQFLDADDLLGPGKIDLQVEMMTADTGIDIAVCEYELCDASGGSRCLMEPSTLAGYALSPEDFLLRWERGFSLPMHCALFRRELLNEEQFPRITRLGKEDWIFWIALGAKSPRFQFHPQVLATYRIHGHNTNTNREGMGLDFLRASMYVLQSRLSTCDNFLEESIDHFRKAYLGSIKHEAIVWSRTHPVD